MGDIKTSASDNSMSVLLKDAKIAECNERKAEGEPPEFRNADFRGADLRNVDAQGVDFTNAYFRGADLRALGLRQSDLPGASLVQAHISGAFFFRAAQYSGNPAVRAAWHANALSTIKLRPAANCFGQVSKAANETMLEY